MDCVSWLTSLSETKVHASVVRTAADGLLSGNSGGERRRKVSLRLACDLYRHAAVGNRAVTELAKPIPTPAVCDAVQRDAARLHASGAHLREAETAKHRDRARAGSQ